MGGNGGEGYTLSISDTNLPFVLGSTHSVICSGGGGGVYYSGPTGSRGGTGAGDGGRGSVVATAGTSYGSGGGGGGYPDPYRNGGAGASGVVVIRYPLS